MKQDDALHSYYNLAILPYLDEFERFRKQKLKAYRIKQVSLILSSIAFLGMLIGFCPTLFNEAYLSFIKGSYVPSHEYNLLIPFALTLLMIMGFAHIGMNNASNEFIQATKNNLYGKIIGFHQELEYYPFNGIPRSIVENSYLFPKFDVFNSEDYIQGEYKKVKLKIAEILLSKVERRQSQVNGRTVTHDEEAQFFRGLFLIINIKKKFSTTTYVVPNSLIKIWRTIPNNLERVTLEDPIFEAIFDVYSDNQVEARYLLTPSFMERLIKLNKNNPLSCCFVDEQMFFALPLLSDFLPSLSLFKPIDFAAAKQVIEQINVLFEIIDTLKLDLNIGI